jgi:hypothetical protein
MKKELLAILLCLSATIAGAQWNYDFGTATGSMTTANTESTSFAPAPPAGGGTARFRIGPNGARFYLEASSGGFGSGSVLRGVAPTATNYGKFSIYGYTPGKTFYTRFSLKLTGNTDGVWHFFQGAGTSFSNNAGFTIAESFAGFRFNIGASSVTVDYRAGAWTALAGVMLTQNTIYKIEVMGNNGIADVNYAKSGAQSVAVNTYDLWINDVLVGNDLPKTGLAANTDVDSYMFYGGSSTDNTANLYLDDITYANNIDATVLPVSLSSVEVYRAGNNGVVKWTTAMEQNSAYFDVMRSADGNNFHYLGRVTAAGNATAPQQYSFTDASPLPGNAYYKLVQVDKDGSKKESKILLLKAQQANVHLSVFPASGGITCVVPSFMEGEAALTVTDIAGRKLYSRQVGKPYNRQCYIPLAATHQVVLVSLATTAGTATAKIVH